MDYYEEILDALALARKIDQENEADLKTLADRVMPNDVALGLRRLFPLSEEEARRHEELRRQPDGATWPEACEWASLSWYPREQAKREAIIWAALAPPKEAAVKLVRMYAFVAAAERLKELEAMSDELSPIERYVEPARASSEAKHLAIVLIGGSDAPPDSISREPGEGE